MRDNKDVLVSMLFLLFFIAVGTGLVAIGAAIDYHTNPWTHGHGWKWHYLFSAHALALAYGAGKYWVFFIPGTILGFLAWSKA
jgi:hypothetical protein